MLSCKYHHDEGNLWAAWGGEKGVIGGAAAAPSEEVRAAILLLACEWVSVWVCECVIMCECVSVWVCDYVWVCECVVCERVRMAVYLSQ